MGEKCVREVGEKQGAGWVGRREEMEIMSRSLWAMFHLSVNAYRIYNNQIIGRKMRLANRTSLRRNLSDPKAIKLKKCEEVIASPTFHKKIFLEPFKLRLSNQKEKPSQKQNVCLPNSAAGEALQTNSKNVLAMRHSPVLENNFQSATMTESELILAKSRLRKRRTLPFCAPFSRSEHSKQNSLQGRQQSLETGQNIIQKFKKRSSMRLLTRQNSHQSLVGRLDPKASAQDDKKSIFYDKETKKDKLKLQGYHQFIKEQTQLHDVQMQSIDSYHQQQIFFSIAKGNNRQMVLQAMQKRWWWSMAREGQEKSINFLWTQLKDKNYGYVEPPQKQITTEDSLSEEEEATQQITSFTLHNHFQENKFISSNLGLYLSMKAYWARKDMKNVDVMLPTFFVSRMMDEQWKAFTKSYFQALEVSKIDTWDIGTNKKYWIIKQFSDKTMSNKIFSTYKEIKLYVERQSRKGSKFLIQRYISKPFLYKKRKFDLRVYALIVRLKQRIHVYMHRQGVISTACEQFDIIDLDNQFSNYTTESIQLEHDKFGEYEPGNKIDFKQFQAHLDTAYGDKYNFMDSAFPLMQQSVSHFAKANSKFLNCPKGGPSFELVQCEFLLDEDFKPWLIDVHTNPCLETYCPTLEKVLPQVIEDTLRHTVDVLFPPPKEWPQSKRHLFPTRLKETGFTLILDGLSECEEDGEWQLSGEVESDQHIYEDNVIDDTEYTESCSNLNDFEYLLSQSALHVR